MIGESTAAVVLSASDDDNLNSILAQFNELYPRLLSFSCPSSNNNNDHNNSNSNLIRLGMDGIAGHQKHLKEAIQTSICNQTKSLLSFVSAWTDNLLFNVTDWTPTSAPEKGIVSTEEWLFDLFWNNSLGQKRRGNENDDDYGPLTFSKDHWISLIEFYGSSINLPLNLNVSDGDDAAGDIVLFWRIREQLKAEGSSVSRDDEGQIKAWLYTNTLCSSNATSHLHGTIIPKIIGSYKGGCHAFWKRVLAQPLQSLLSLVCSDFSCDSSLLIQERLESIADCLEQSLTQPSHLELLPGPLSWILSDLWDMIKDPVMMWTYFYRKIIFPNLLSLGTGFNPFPGPIAYHFLLYNFHTLLPSSNEGDSSKKPNATLLKRSTSSSIAHSFGASFSQTFSSSHGSSSKSKRKSFQAVPISSHHDSREISQRKKRLILEADYSGLSKLLCKTLLKRLPGISLGKVTENPFKPCPINNFEEWRLRERNNQVIFSSLTSSMTRDLAYQTLFPSSNNCNDSQSQNNQDDQSSISSNTNCLNVEELSLDDNNTSLFPPDEHKIYCLSKRKLPSPEIRIESLSLFYTFNQAGFVPTDFESILPIIQRNRTLFKSSLLNYEAVLKQFRSDLKFAKAYLRCIESNVRLWAHWTSRLRIKSAASGGYVPQLKEFNQLLSLQHECCSKQAQQPNGDAFEESKVMKYLSGHNISWLHQVLTEQEDNPGQPSPSQLAIISKFQSFDKINELLSKCFKGEGESNYDSELTEWALELVYGSPNPPTARTLTNSHLLFILEPINCWSLDISSITLFRTCLTLSCQRLCLVLQQNFMGQSVQSRRTFSFTGGSGGHVNSFSSSSSPCSASVVNGDSFFPPFLIVMLYHMRKQLHLIREIKSNDDTGTLKDGSKMQPSSAVTAYNQLVDSCYWVACYEAALSFWHDEIK